MISAKIFGSFPDNSGYGESNRAEATALFCAGVNLTLHSVPQTIETKPTGWTGDLCKHLEDRSIEYKIIIVHLTPDLIPKYMEDGKYHIARLPWEVDKLPREWVEPLNKVSEIWTMTDAQAEVIKKSGVTTQIHVFPEPLDTSMKGGAVDRYIVPGFNGTLFYSIFHWIERKDPHSLLTAYWRAFEGKKDVLLLLKTFRVGYTAKDFELIKNDIAKWKKDLGLSHYAEVGLIEELWPYKGIQKLHEMGGTFVSTSHGEGFNRPAGEAALYGNPIIMTGQTGLADILPKDSFYPVECTSSPVVPQSFINWYQKGQKWVTVNQKHLEDTMLEVYENQETARARGANASVFVQDNLSYETVGRKMKDRLSEIERFL